MGATSSNQCGAEFWSSSADTCLFASTSQWAIGSLFRVALTSVNARICQTVDMVFNYPTLICYHSIVCIDVAIAFWYCIVLYLDRNLLLYPVCKRIIGSVEFDEHKALGSKSDNPSLSDRSTDGITISYSAVPSSTERNLVHTHFCMC